MGGPLQGVHVITLESVASLAGGRLPSLESCFILRDLGARVEWWGLGGPGPRTDLFAGHGFPTRVLGMPKHSHRFDTSRALSAALAEAAPDVVHAQCYEPGLHASRAKSAGTLRRLVITHREAKQRLTRRLFAWPYRNLADLVTAPSPSAAEGMRRWFGYPADRVVALQNSVADAFLTAPGRREALLAELGLAQAYPIVTWVAGFKRGKGHADLLHAFKHVAARYPEARLLFVGSGKHAGELQALSRRLDLAEQVVFAGSRSDVPDLLGITDVFACPSHAETLCMAVVEAMSVGRPVVSTAVWGPCDHITHGATGLLVPVGDVHALAGAILALADDPARAARLGAAARAYALRTFSKQTVSDLVASVFQRVLA